MEAKKQLIDVEPTHCYLLEDGSLLQIGEMVLWRSFGVVYLTPTQPRYVMYKVMLGETGQPEIRFDKERPLTSEEVAHFTKLAKEADRDNKREQHQQQRRELAQQQQKAITEATGGRVLM